MKSTEYEYKRALLVIDYMISTRLQRFRKAGRKDPDSTMMEAAILLETFKEIIDETLNPPKKKNVKLETN